MDRMARRHLESRLEQAKHNHTGEVNEMHRHLRHLDDMGYSAAAWRNMAATAGNGAFYMGQIDALTTALAADDASNANPQE